MKLQDTLHSQLSADFIDYCNVRGIDIKEWFKWKKYLAKEQKKIHDKLLKC
jgi:hypothetical protein